MILCERIKKLSQNDMTIVKPVFSGDSKIGKTKVLITNGS